MFSFYTVGGCVRDELLGIQSKDIDYVAVPNPEMFGRKVNDINDAFDVLVNYLTNNKYEIFLETRDCYTIRAKFPKTHPNAGIVADFVLARKETGYEAGTRRPIVVPGTLLDDLTRRDFTVNAIAKDVNGVLYDPFGGQEDLKNKLLRTPISGQITFADDPLRLLRAIRFAITKGFLIDAAIHDILLYFNYNKDFHVVSEERIREELYKCFRHDTRKTLYYLDKYASLKFYIFSKTNLWLKPTNEQ